MESRVVDVSPMIDYDELSIKKEDFLLSDGEETSSFHSADRIPVVKLENEAAAEDGIVETGNFTDFFETETDQTRGIMIETVDVDSAENSPPEEYAFSYVSSSTVAESNTLIKKEKDVDMGDEEFQAIVESSYTLCPKDECSESRQSTTLRDQANGSSLWGLCEEDCSISRSTAAEDEHFNESQQSRAYYYSNGFKLAHGSVVVKDLKSHLITRAVEKQFLCTYCPAKFSRNSRLTIHLRIHSEEKPFSCKFCSAKFGNPGNLKRHVKIHTNDKPYSCSYCPAKFPRNRHLKDHLTTHTGERPFSCTVCGAKFKTSSNLNSHRKTHTNEKPYLCTHCPAKFSQNSRLTIHLRIHTKEKPFSCKFCSAKFGDPSNLRNHVMVHTNTNLFECTYCSKKYRQSGTLKRHLITHTDKFDII